MSLEAKIVTLTNNADQPIAPRTDADAVSYNENSTVKDILDLFANGIILKEGIDYGTSFPSGAAIGRLFFKKVT